MIALSSQQTIAFILVALVLVLFFAGLAYVSRSRRRARERPDIPPAMQPGPSDPDLEKPNLEKLQGWALASFLILAIWIPGIWLLEPSINKDQEIAFSQEAVERGEKSVQLFSETNIFGVGCVRCHGDGLTGGLNLFNGNLVQVPPLTNVCAGPNGNPPHVQIHNLVDVRNTIMQGRPPTDMPSWSVRFSGGLDDQQIQDIVTYLVKLNMENVPFKDNVCINPKAKGYQTPLEPAK